MKVYTSPTCPKCHILTGFLKEKNISFEEIDISKNREAVKPLVEKGLSALPVVEYEREYYQGVEVSKIKELLKIE